VLGAVSVAGNCPYQSRVDRSQVITDQVSQRANKVVILGSGPFEALEYNSNKIKINGMTYDNAWWHPSGYQIDPAQSKAEAVDGTIGGESGRPSISVYLGAPAVAVPVDIRAQYDRNFPVYGFAGCSYIVARLMDSTKATSWNLIATVKGRKCRTFTTAGFDQTTVTDEAVGTGDGAAVRFKLDYDDIASVTSVSVGGVAYSEVSAANQTGLVYGVNLTKGYVEFLTAPAVSAAVVCTYKYYPRAWTQNPASQIVYLLTEPIRGKGNEASKINWASFVTARDYSDADVTWQMAGGPVTGDRYHSDYSIDYRKPIQEHLRAILDACYGTLFLSGGLFTMRIRSAEASVFSFTAANILQDSFVSEMVDRSARANRMHVFYHALETFSAETEVVRDDPAEQEARVARLGNDGVVEETLRMLAVSTQTQAERLGETMLREDVGSRWLCEFKTTVKGLALEPGDVVDVTHPSQPSWAAKDFRIEEVSLDEMDRLIIRASEYVPSAYI
jgi:hypothetical protein